MAEETEKETSEKSTELEILFPTIEIAGFKVRPWSYDQFMAALPLIVKMRDGLRASNIGLSDLMKLKETDADKIAELIATVAPAIPVRETVSLTLGKTTEEVGAWEFDRTITLFLAILLLNAKRIKNLLGLGKTVMSKLNATAP